MGKVEFSPLSDSHVEKKRKKNEGSERNLIVELILEGKDRRVD